MNSLPRPAPDWALFLDFDGTLVEIEDHPDKVTLPPGMAPRLRHLQAALDDAVAIVSGRALADLEGLLHPLRLPLAGLHGLERRDARGCVHRDERDRERLDAVRDAIAGFVTARPGLYAEDKGGALALHYRAAPEREQEVAAFLERQRRQLGDGFHIQAGKQVFELKPVGRDKGRVVREFMAEAPFAGRTPVFIGDDRTDEDAFAAVNALGGVSIRVGEHHPDTAATATLPSVAATLDWLDRLPQELPATAPDQT
ncbi:MAG: trehalose-phosphatase [Halofilum sp. (in: g-proteobacteria)]|nr:trehalose-phosphatase [Halofilum sp. (in: g-proteobacteria)]